ncbi:MAG: DUF1538 domain-containing protein [Clostridia bacterium]|nr:DUF1538 domain-containing protein [Clostridia bacterium]
MILELLKNAKECAVALLPLIVTFFVFQLLIIKMGKMSLKRVLIGVVISYVGLVILISGLNYCYVPVAKEMGIKFAKSEYRFLIVPIGFLLGFVMTKVEPSVKVLVTNIEHASGGALKRNLLANTMAVGVGISLGLAMLKILLNISLWYIVVPGYIMIILLSFVIDEKFTAIALDAGGVTTGVMTTTFLLPLALGLAEGLPWTNTVIDGFGLIAIVAMTPIIMVMLLGAMYQSKKEAKKDE